MLVSGVGHLSGNSKLNKIFQRRDCVFFTFVLPVPIISGQHKGAIQPLVPEISQYTPAKGTLTWLLTQLGIFQPEYLISHVQFSFLKKILSTITMGSIIWLKYSDVWWIFVTYFHVFWWPITHTFLEGICSFHCIRNNNNVKTYFSLIFIYIS